MYTKLDDWKLANQVVEYLTVNPRATQKELCEKFMTNEHRLKQLEEEHLINISHTRRNYGNTTGTQE
jgi:hypothetical protein